MTIYVERSGGRWRAFFDTEDGKLSFYSQIREEAISKAIKATGYQRKQIRTIDI
jgi:hypothetical protein